MLTYTDTIFHTGLASGFFGKIQSSQDDDKGVALNSVKRKKMSYSNPLKTNIQFITMTTDYKEV